MYEIHATCPKCRERLTIRVDETTEFVSEKENETSGAAKSLFPPMEMRGDTLVVNPGAAEPNDTKPETDKD